MARAQSHSSTQVTMGPVFGEENESVTYSWLDREMTRFITPSPGCPGDQGCYRKAKGIKTHLNGVGVGNHSTDQQEWKEENTTACERTLSHAQPLPSLSSVCICATPCSSQTETPVTI